MRAHGRALGFLGVVLGAAAALPAAAPATFPGANGTIAATITGSVVGLRLDGSEPRIFTASEDVGRFSWSADGTRLAGSGDHGVLVGPEGGNPKLVVAESGAFLPTRVSWSPDGRRLVYARGFFDGSEERPLVVVGAAGGTPTPITGGAGNIDDDPDWSPTGDRIAFARWRTQGPGSGLWVVPAGGGPATLLVSDAALGIAEEASTPPVDWPSWSPDGQNLAFAARNGDDLAVYVVSAAGGEPMRIAAGAFPAWSPDGSLIAFRGGAGISVVRPDGTGLRVIAADFPGAHLSWQAVRGTPPDIIAARAVNPVVHFPPSQARIRREARRGRILIRGRTGFSSAASIVVRFERRVETLELRRTLERLRSGRRVGRRCVASRARVPRSRRCTVRSPVPPSIVDGPFRIGAQSTHMIFDGTWGDDGRLPVGRYRLTLIAVSPAGAGRGRSVDVRVGGGCLAARMCRFVRRLGPSG